MRFLFKKSGIFNEGNRKIFGQKFAGETTGPSCPPMIEGRKEGSFFFKIT